MSRLWLNNDFSPAEAIIESIIIYHVVLSGDACTMRWPPDLKSLLKQKTLPGYGRNLFCGSLLYEEHLFKDITGRKW